MSIKFGFKRIFKKIKEQKIAYLLGSYITYLFLRIVFATYRLDVKNLDNSEKKFGSLDGIYYFWHQNILSVSYLFFKKNVLATVL